MGIIVRNGVYYAEFFDGTRLPNAKRFSLRTKNKAEARRRYVVLEYDWHGGEFDPWNDNPFAYKRAADEPVPILSAAISQFIEKKKADDKAENTVVSYERVLNLLQRAVGDVRLDRLKAEALAAFIRDKSLARTTQHMRYRHVRAFVCWCVKRKYIKTNPLDDVEPPQKPDKLPKALTEAELTSVCNAVRADYDDKRRRGIVQEGELIWRIPLFQFAYFTGMRPSELARLRWEHIDSEARRIYIYKQKNRKEQTIPLNKRAAAVLASVLQGEPDDYVFRPPYSAEKERGTRFFVERASRSFTKAKRDAGIRRQVSLYGTRHGFCTRIAEAGKSGVLIMEAARHSDVRTSMLYVHMANEHLKAELDDVFG